MIPGDGARLRGPTRSQPPLPPRSALLLLAALLGALALGCGDGAGDGEAPEDDAPAGLSLAPAGLASTTEAAAAVAPAEASETSGFVLTSLVSDTTVNERVLEVRGIVDPGSSVTVGDSVATVGPYGHFAVEVELEPGDNLRTFAVTAENGSAVLHSMTVHYEPTPTPEPSTLATSAEKPKDPAKLEGSTKTKTGDHTKTRDGDYTKTDGQEQGFSAWQKYGSCSEDPPYDVFKGTAAPGATVTVHSLYGSGSTVADESGKWWLTVYFPDAPVGAAFEVVASDGTSSKTLSFVRK